MRTVKFANHKPLPRGLELESLSTETGKVTIFVASSGESRARCPVCGHDSPRVRSRYHRTVSDLP